MKFQIVSLCSITSQCCSDRLSREFSESRLSRDFSENRISFDFSEQRFLSDKNETSFSAQSSRDFEVKVFCKYFESSITSRIFSTKLRRDSPVILDSSSQFYLYRNFIHLLFPDQVKIFFGQYN